LDLLRSVRANGATFDAHVFVLGLRLIIICALDGWVVLGGHLVLLGCALKGPIVFALDGLVFLSALGKQPRNLGVTDLALQRQQRVHRRGAVRLRATFGFPLERALVVAWFDLISGHELTLFSH